MMKITLTVEQGNVKFQTTFTSEQLEAFYEEHRQSMLDVTCIQFIDEIKKQLNKGTKK